jgi:hypothetical protein
MEAAEYVYLTRHPGRGGRGRRTDRYQAVRSGKRGAHFRRQVAGGGQFLAVAEDRGKPTRHRAARRNLADQPARHAIGFKAPMEASTERGVLVAVAYERGVARPCALAVRCHAPPPPATIGKAFAEVAERCNAK